MLEPAIAVTMKVLDGLPSPEDLLEGRPVAPVSSMIDLDPTTIVLGVLFSSIGFIAFRYGRKMEMMSPVVIGLALMFYPFFVRGPIGLLTVGAGLTAALFVFRD